MGQTESTLNSTAPVDVISILDEREKRILREEAEAKEKLKKEKESMCHDAVRVLMDTVRQGETRFYSAYINQFEKVNECRKIFTDNLPDNLRFTVHPIHFAKVENETKARTDPDEVETTKKPYMFVFNKDKYAEKHGSECDAAYGKGNWELQSTITTPYIKYDKKFNYVDVVYICCCEPKRRYSDYD